MFEIDYSLIPLSPEDRAAVERRVAGELARGVVPKLAKSDAGRVAVLNPDPVQTGHHIPDELRAHLRRIMVETSEGHFDNRPEKLHQALTDADEPLRLLIIELKSRFTYFPGFLDMIPKLRRQYPGLGVYLSGEQPVVLEKLQQVMRERKVPLQLTYGDARGTVEISDPGELTQVVAEHEPEVALAIPFFTQIRLNLEGGKPSAFNLDSLRHLHPQFGHGPIREVDMGGGRKEKAVILDLPVRLIRDFQFRQDRGLDFHGIMLDGRTVLSRHFAQEKLEFRWIPFHSVEAFMQKTPGHEVQTAKVARTHLLRVNCFNGQTTFVTRAAGDQISLDDVQYFAFRLGPGGAKGAEGAPAEGQGDASLFDGLILPGPTTQNLSPVQRTVRNHIYGRVIREAVEKARKLEIFTSNLKVGAVGPLAGQTLKILRRYGLEGLIEPGGFHYLCDLPQQMPTYFQTPERFEEHFTNLLQTLRKVVSDAGEGKIRMGDMAHNLPVTLEWIDAPEFDFRHAAPMEMEVVYNEMQSLISFIGHEFRRNFDIGKEDMAFFEKIGECQRAGLLVNWMADFKNGAFGPPMPRGRHPDFLFFGTPADKMENDSKFFFPGLACAELFHQPETQKLYGEIDYDFSVFLEQQISLADHAARDEGGGGTRDFGPYLERKIGEARQELATLEAAKDTITAGDSPEFQAMLKEEEAAYHERFQAVTQSLEKTGALHRETAEEFLALAKTPPAGLGEPGEPPPEWFSGEGAEPHAFGRTLLERVRANAAGQGEALARKAKTVRAGFRERLVLLREGMAAADGARRSQKTWQAALGAQMLAGHGRTLHGKVPGRQEALRKLGEVEREAHRRRIRAQLGDLQADLQRMDERIAQHEQRTAQMLRSMRGGLERLEDTLEEVEQEAKGDSPAEAHGGLEAFVERAGRVLAPMGSLAERIAQAAGQYETLLVRKTRLAGQQYALALDGALLEAAISGAAPALAAPPPPEEEAGLKAREEHERAAHQQQKGRAEGLGPSVAETPEALAGLLRNLGPEVEAVQRARDTRVAMEKAFARKVRRHQSIAALENRRKLMEAELADLPARVREKFMPARKELLLRLFIPEAEKRIAQFQRAQTLFKEIQAFRPQKLRSLYLERAVFRRFSSNQFLRGAYVAIGTQSEKAKRLRNVLPAVNLFHRNLHFNFARQHGKKAERVSLKHLGFMEGEAVWEFIQEQLSGHAPVRYDYVVLPATLELDEAVDLMNRKGKLNHGVPELVLIYLSTFDTGPILADPRLRAAYFRAQRHNLILNIDGRSLVDNPQTIGLRLLQETLGSTFDTPVVEDMEEEDRNVAFKV